MKVLITGATGFIGSSLIRFLCSQGVTVRALCRPTSDISVFSDNPVQVSWGDVVNLPSVERAIQGCDYVFHLAGYAKNWAKNSRTFSEVNVTGTENVLKASRDFKVKKVVVTSTYLTFSPSGEEPTKESDPRTVDFFGDYDRSKFYAEKLVNDYIQSGLSVVIVNPTRVFGPGLLSEGNSVTKMIQLYLQGKWRLILGDGSAVGNYVFIDDLVRGYWLTLKHRRPGEKYILGGKNLTYNAFLELLADISKRHFRMFHVPVWLALAFSNSSILLVELLRGLLFYTAWEFFFRGFLLFGLQKDFGIWAAICIQTIPSCLWHIGLPTGEIFASIAAGILFGILAVRTRSILWAFLLHLLIGVGTDLFIVMT